MARNLRKKYPLKPPTKHPPLELESNISEAMSSLLSQEKLKMVARAIRSGKHHGINIEHGASNKGTGDCAFEAAIYNINNRKCFEEKFSMSIDYYRRIWSTDMANRTVNTAWNIYSHEEWMEGWRQMLTPGAYERGIFGDLMLPGIACGMHKFLLIFNTDKNTPHDPIYVVDPTMFGIEVDTEIPIVLAYNMVHYESMHPCAEKDTQATINLVKDYLEGRYKFRRKDIPFLLGLEDQTPTEDHELEAQRPPTESDAIVVIKESSDDLKVKRLEKHDDNPKRYIVKNIPETNGKIKCPLCKNFYQNIVMHFKRKQDCRNVVDCEDFLRIYEENVTNKKREENTK